MVSYMCVGQSILSFSELFVSHTILGPLLISPEMVRGTAVPLKHHCNDGRGLCGDKAAEASDLRRPTEPEANCELKG